MNRAGHSAGSTAASARAAIVDRRLHSHSLIGPGLSSPVDVVRAFGAVQAQDYAAAKWAVGQRAAGATDDGLDRLFDDGVILRTHVLRPTWHFVLPEDIGWLLECTAPRLWDRLALRRRQLDLDPGTLSRAVAVFERAIRADGPLTRRELGERLSRAGISPDGQRLPYLLLSAELKMALTSGPRRGKDFTFALMDDRAPSPSIRDRASQLAEIAGRYFKTRGPAQLADFVWWSGLGTADARLAIEGAGTALAYEEILGGTYWYVSGSPHGGGTPAGRRSPVAHLLPNFDEFTVAYRDRSALVESLHPLEPGLFAYGNVLSNILLIEGRVRGGWRRLSERGGVLAEIRLERALTRSEREATDQAAARFGRFLGRRAEIVLVEPRGRSGPGGRAHLGVR